ncbi:MAG: NifU family protein [Clostridia bacterium]|nr:NifU family protein [Clostridia bacterium]
MQLETYINEVIRPKIQGDGGEMVYLSREGDSVTVLLRGECSKCPITGRCLSWVEERIRIDLGENVRLKAIRKKPFFWDN